MTPVKNQKKKIKKNIAAIIKDYILNGGFIFAMCSATDSFDIALASKNVDIASSVFDGTPIDNQYQNKLANIEVMIEFTETCDYRSQVLRSKLEDFWDEFFHMTGAIVSFNYL